MLLVCCYKWILFNFSQSFSFRKTKNKTLVLSYTTCVDELTYILQININYSKVQIVFFGSTAIVLMRSVLIICGFTQENEQ